MKQPSGYRFSDALEIVDGAPAARFATRLCELIEEGYGLEVDGMDGVD